MLKRHLYGILGRTQILYSAINIIGLAIGLASVILLFLFVKFQWSYDKHHENYDRIYRFSIQSQTSGSTGPIQFAGNVVPAAAQLKADYPEQIEQTARIWGQRTRLARGNQSWYEDDFRWADNSLFEIFDFQWIRGNPQEALVEPFAVVLTQSSALKYFGNIDAMGQTLTMGSNIQLQVTGIVEDLPEYTHLSGAAFASMDSGFKVLGYDYADNWSFRVFHTYALLRQGISIDSISGQLQSFVLRHKRPFDFASDMSAMKVTDIHLHSNLQGEFKPGGSATTVYTFSAVAFCILLIACFNFMNLATARAAGRAREIGVRKTIGASRTQLAARFLNESIFMTTCAMTLAIAIVEFSLPVYSRVLLTDFDNSLLFNANNILGLLGFTLLVGLLTGSYPAFYLSGFQPVRILKGDLSQGRSSAMSRSILVVVQFSISLVLVIATVVIFRQINFALDVERGFETENMVILEGSATEGLGDQWQELKTRLLDSPQISHVSAANVHGLGGGWSVRTEGSNAARTMRIKRIGYDFFETYDIPLVSGRNFSLARGTDQFNIPTNDQLRPRAGIIINEQAALEFGWSFEQAIGKKFEVDFSADFSRAVVGQIIAVVKNTYPNSAKEAQQAMAYIAPGLTWAGDSPSFFSATVRITGELTPQTLDSIDAAWREFNPNLPLSRRLLQSDYETLYGDEKQQAQVFAWFSALAIFVACLGLMGLVSSMAETRVREIGVRKILGSTVWGIVQIFTTKFAKLILLSNLIAWPTAYFFMQRWLTEFAYRTDLELMIFVACSILTGLAIWFTLAVVSIRAAVANPVDALRYE